MPPATTSQIMVAAKGFGIAWLVINIAFALLCIWAAGAGDAIRDWWARRQS